MTPRKLSTRHEKRILWPDVTPALNPKDIPAMLRDLKGLLDDGIITEEEFLNKKKELLSRW
jgi:Short C-terminal domain